MKRVFYSLIIAALVSTLALGAEVRKLTQEDIEWGDPSTTVTSPAGHVGHRIDNTYKLSAPYVDVRAYGAKGDGVTDDTAAIQAAITTGKHVYMPPGTYSISSTLNFQSMKGMRFSGATPTGQTRTGNGITLLIWNGANGGTVVYIKDTRDSTFENFVIDPGSGTIGVGIDMDYTYPNVPVSTNNLFRGVTVGVSTTGIRVSHTATNNNDLNTFEDVYIDGAGTNGYLFEDVNSKYNRIVRGSIGERTYGIYVDAGSFNSESTNFSLNTTDIYLVSPTDAIYLHAPQSEWAEKFIDTSAQTGASWALTVIGGRYGLDGLGADNVYIHWKFRGALNLIGGDFAGGVVNSGFRILMDGSTPGAVLNAIGNNFPNSSPFSNYEDDATTNNFSLNSIGNSYPTGTNDFSPMLTMLGPKWAGSSATTKLNGVTGISGTWNKANNLRGQATFDNAATVAVTFGTAEYDQVYFVSTSGNASETFFVTSKTANGFTLNSSNVTSTAIVDWIMMR